MEPPRLLVLLTPVVSEPLSGLVVSSPPSSSRRPRLPRRPVPAFLVSLSPPSSEPRPRLPRRPAPAFLVVPSPASSASRPRLPRRLVSSPPPSSSRPRHPRRPVPAFHRHPSPSTSRSSTPPTSPLDPRTNSNHSHPPRLELCKYVIKNRLPSSFY